MITPRLIAHFEQVFSNGKRFFLMCRIAPPLDRRWPFFFSRVVSEVSALPGGESVDEDRRAERLASIASAIVRQHTFEGSQSGRYRATAHGRGRVRTPDKGAVSSPGGDDWVAGSIGCPSKLSSDRSQKRLGARRTHRPYRFRRAEHVHNSLDVVGQHVQAHLSANVLESAR
jgi:hypothetical protein